MYIGNGYIYKSYTGSHAYYAINAMPIIGVSNILQNINTSDLTFIFAHLSKNKSEYLSTASHFIGVEAPPLSEKPCHHLLH